MARLSIEDVEFVDSATLVKDPSHRRQLRSAQFEGRLHPDLALLMGVETGQHKCLSCGMRHWKADDAKSCCDHLLSGTSERKRRNMDGWRGMLSDYAITDADALIEAIKEKTGSRYVHEAERKSGFCQSYFSKFKYKKDRPITLEVYDKLHDMFGDSIPGVGKRKDV